jgi:hypothetical protein
LTLILRGNVAVLAEETSTGLDDMYACSQIMTVGGGSAGASTASDSTRTRWLNVFTDDVTKLLDDSAGPPESPKAYRSRRLWY